MTGETQQPELSCAAVRDAWHARCDGELSADAQAALDAHVSDCSDCRAYIGDLAAIAGALAELRVSTQHIGASAPSIRRAPASWRRNLTRVAAAFALLLGAGVITYLAALDAPHQPGPRPPSVHAPAPAPAAVVPDVQVALTGESDDRFIPVARETGRPNVHVFVLYLRP